jgi:hypothetical protein
MALHPMARLMRNKVIAPYKKPLGDAEGIGHLARQMAQ